MFYTCSATGTISTLLGSCVRAAAGSPRLPSKQTVGQIHRTQWEMPLFIWVFNPIVACW